MRVALMTVAVVLGLAASVADAVAQADPPRRRPPRIIVTPQPAATPYPLSGVAFPGPGYVRDCTAWLEPEARASGTVIVPRMRCRWVRGRS
jgi:hypothetical protein